MEEFMRGARMAYEDCADLVQRLSDGLPEELKFAKSEFTIISDGMKQKIDLLDKKIKQLDSEKN